MKDFNKNNEETHPHLPSGAWEGFYCYHHSQEQHKMSIDLIFSMGLVYGGGVDDVAPFTWKGRYDLETCKLEMTKSYATHQVYYRGDIDENGIWGTWEMMNSFERVPQHMMQPLKQAFKHVLTGGFHIWPKKNAKNMNSERISEDEKESEILKELFLEVFA